MRLSFAFIAFCILLPLSLRAEESCTPFNMHDPGGSMERVEVQDQKEIGTCYAYAVSQAYDAYRFTHGDRDYQHVTSGAMIALGSSKVRDESISKGGNFSKAFEVLQKQGSCSRAFINARAADGIMSRDIENLLVCLNQAMGDHPSETVPIQYSTNQKMYRALMCEAPPFGIDNELQRLEYDRIISRSFSSRTTSETTEYIRYLSAIRSCGIMYASDDSKLLTATKQELDSFARSSTIDTHFIEKLLPLKCDDEVASRMKVNPLKRIPSNLINSFTTVQTDQQAKQLLAEKLSSKKSQPLSINFCGSIYENGKSNDPTRADGVPTFQGPIKCKGHAALVVGRRWKKDEKTGIGSCQYLLRNAYGKNGITPMKDWEEDRQHSSVWIDENALIKTIYSINQLQESN